MKIDQYTQVWKIWEESKLKLNAYLLAKFKNKELADNVSQEIVLKIHKSCCSGKEINNLNSWLFQIAHNAGVDYLKKDSSAEEIKEFVTEENPKNAWLDLIEILEPLVEFLPPEVSVPLKLADIEGKPQKEIAEELGLSLTATKSRIQRARKKLKEEILTCCELEFNNNGDLVDFQIKDSCTPLKDFKK